MNDFDFSDDKIPAARLKEIKRALEKANDRELSEDEVMEAAKFIYKMAHMALEVTLTEANWKRKLTEFPKGYAFEEKGYSCRLCHEGSDAGMWYDQYGLKCMHCQKAVESGLIPGSIMEDTESFYSEYELDYYFGVGGKALTQWLGMGIIKTRIIRCHDRPARTHIRLFLISDNEGFLPPKKLLASPGVLTEEINGKEYQRSMKWYECCDPFEYLKDYKIMDYLRPKES